MSSRPPTYDPVKGVLAVHVLDDLVVRMIPGAGQASFAGRTLFFEILDTEVSVGLVDHPTNVNGAMIVVTPTDLFYVGTYSRFALVDRTDGGNDVIWSGGLERYK